MRRWVAFALLALMPACASVTSQDSGPSANANAAAAQRPADCAATYQPETPEYQTCIEAQAAPKWMMAAIVGGSLVAVVASAAMLSDVNAKSDIVPVGTLDNGLALYRFRYRWSDRQFVGVLAQEVQRVIPDAVARQRDGYLHVDYGRLGVQPMTWEAWQTGGYVLQPLPSFRVAAALLPR